MQWVKTMGRRTENGVILVYQRKMSNVFWDAKRILFMVNLAKFKTILSEYYTCLLDQLDNEVDAKRSRMLKKKLLIEAKKRCFDLNNCKVKVYFRMT